ncbi:nickel pincer cofactor biosynthesis protein LarB [Leptolinea tardivitalis]|uniref:1-(5-phosphoribosyl)-5-amino-4-imidazole-carboxylate carboxylase n=1 Tax=Leptolinea tardivitalis TaxID=229920 RepID=A0A0P6X205_9CHLR|nr:nickel pincer cofactor biosynthesis protein LarB [Leptolinea tardivitalis]KPL73342.1 1-(5-phosphoribosyl)-5-amino-4-imidazole-carboxylate carboxylase [Leptolinea tardivitalis]GAP21479.1 NCAIR mutase (PurE)-related protein [Leptolinea tardivitalis]
MEIEKLKQLLEQVKSGQIDVDAALEQLRRLPYENLDGFAQLDHHRTLRNGFPEVVLGQGKQPEQVAAIVCRLAEHSDKVLVTRVDQAMADIVCTEMPDVVYKSLPRLLVLDRSKPIEKIPGILVVTAGTADMPVAEEAAVTAELMNNSVERMYDVGVAGIHRLLGQVENLWRARVIIVVAGMDGALPSVIGGLVSVPVIAVPTSVGYGASFNGLAPLLTMLNSCAAGVGVVNIDNGFGAAVLASRINQSGQ